VIAVSEAVASALRESGTVAADKIVVVLNGVDGAKFAAARQNFNRESFLISLQLPANCWLVGTIGELSPLKGQKDMLEAAPEILQKHPQTYFVIAGMDHSHDKRNRRALEEQIREANLSGRVKLVSWLDNLAQLYCALDVFVSSSHSESFGLAIAEAMASATAVVATETEGAKEIIRDGKTGLLVPIGDEKKLAASVSLLLDDEQKRVRMSREAQLDVTTRFSLERMVAETEEIYRNSLGR
jgi:glycosyltransferase involved in cell wall biosynthesis